MTLEARIKALATGLGFCRVAIGPAGPLPGHVAYRRFVGAGMHGAMGYLARDGALREAPERLLPGASSLIAVALAYRADLPAPPEPVDGRPAPGERLRGRIARYALGEDYHRVMHQRLAQLHAAIGEHLGRPVRARVAVDTLPLLEREAAARAGLGFVGKHGVLIAPGLGSWLLLGTLLVELALEPDSAEPGRCGRCQACLDACPTQAFDAAYVLDPRRCISYLTIEHRGPVPRELRPRMGRWVFGCDVCQEVCPFVAGRVAPPDPALAARDAERAYPPLDWLLGVGSQSWRRFARHTALTRATATMMRRNAAIALGNSADGRAVAPLLAALEGDRSGLVREHAAWALGQLRATGLDAAPARRALEHARRHDPEPRVREEASWGLEPAGASQR